MTNTAKRSRHGKTTVERQAEMAAERTVRHAAGLTLGQAHQVARSMPSRLIETVCRGSVIVSVFAA
jgi:hypothetical protein